MLPWPGSQTQQVPAARPFNPSLYSSVCVPVFSVCVRASVSVCVCGWVCAIIVKSAHKDASVGEARTGINVSYVSQSHFRSWQIFKRKSLYKSKTDYKCCAIFKLFSVRYSHNAGLNSLTAHTEKVECNHASQIRLTANSAIRPTIEPSQLSHQKLRIINQKCVK